MPGGTICGIRKEPLAGMTVRATAWALRKKFGDHLGTSPLHQRPLQGKEHQLLPVLGDLLTGMESLDPNVKRQKAMSPSLLRNLPVGTQLEVMASSTDHAANLIIGAFFFAMQACKYVQTPTAGKTKMITLEGVKFFTKDRSELDQLDPDLPTKAH